MTSIQSTPAEIVTEIVMSRDARPWLAVEGFSDEILLRSRNFNRPVKIVVGYGWEGVRDIILEHSKEKSDAIVMGLVDRDYRDHRGCQVNSEKLVLTDLRDIENMMFSSSALGRVISEYASINKIPIDGNGHPDIIKIRGEIYSVAVQLGKLRIYCETDGLEISFKEIEHKKFICDKTLSINVPALLGHVNGKNPGKPPLNQSNWEAAQALSWPGNLGRPEFVANGHDIMAVISVALRRMWGTRGGSIDAAFVEGIFRVGYSDADLESTQMWCELNQCIQIAT
ncbi:DUF4435 domain-containing protein [Paraburkholderia sp. GAS32]|uniref:DUF4435 domain-containing protein n=1 Tax=Paraburkholderia sp. GAS32 TaxID=3035129 RepID=UPI003D1BD39F